MKGYVRTITPTGDPTQRAFRARLALPSAEILPLGMTLEVNIITRKVDHALLVPRSALASSHLWVVDDGQVRKRQVRAGIIGASDAQIISGLRRGDLVIDAPAADLRDGERVSAR